MAVLVELVGRLTTPTPWLQAAVAIARGRFDRAADLYAQIGSLPDEAFARLQGAKQLLATGRRAEGNIHLQRVVAFYREVGASAYLREAKVLLAATASPAPIAAPVALVRTRGFPRAGQHA